MRDFIGCLDCSVTGCTKCRDKGFKIIQSIPRPIISVYQPEENVHMPELKSFNYRANADALGYVSYDRLTYREYFDEFAEDEIYDPCNLFPVGRLVKTVFVISKSMKGIR